MLIAFYSADKENTWTGDRYSKTRRPVYNTQGVTGQGSRTVNTEGQQEGISEVTDKLPPLSLLMVTSQTHKNGAFDYM